MIDVVGELRLLRLWLCVFLLCSFNNLNPINFMELIHRGSSAWVYNGIYRTMEDFQRYIRRIEKIPNQVRYFDFSFQFILYIVQQKTLILSISISICIFSSHSWFVIAVFIFPSINLTCLWGWDRNSVLKYFPVIVRYSFLLFLSDRGHSQSDGASDTGGQNKSSCIYGK